MMTQGNRSLHVSGSKMANANDVHMDVNATNALQHLKHQLLSCQADNKKLTDQLNCLVSLIKRSWSGDKHATVHLSNIVGLEPPSLVLGQDGSIARPNSQMYQTPPQKTRCERNWERLAMKLLDREYHAVQQEIREYQQRYIANRQAYMDAVLQDHHQSMGRIPLHRNTEPNRMVEEVDTKFIRHTKSLQRMGANTGKYRRAQSAGNRRKVPVGEAVEQMEVSLRELVGETPSSEHFLAGQTLSEPRTLTASAKYRPQTSAFPRHPPPNTYNDPERYTQNNLYSLNESDGVKRPRPVSASSLREGDMIRSRPRSGRPTQVNGAEKANCSPVFVTQRNERPMKYETTRPVSSKPKSVKQRRNSTGGPMKKSASDIKITVQPQTDVINATSKKMSSTGDADSNYGGSAIDKENNSVSHMGDNSFRGDFSGEDSEGFITERDMSSKPPMAVRVKSAFTRRPAFIDEFAKDEQAMRDLEDDFKKTALSLQKKLGIGESGMVTID